MNLETETDQVFELEPERYEFHESGWNFDLGRRDFLKILGGGLLVFCLGQDDQAQESGRPGAGVGEARRGMMGGEQPRQIEAWLHVGEDGTVTASTGKVEVGQNARTSLTMAVADELNLPVASVRMVMGDTDHVPYDMGTFGSRTTPTMVPQMRRAAAAARIAAGPGGREMGRRSRHTGDGRRQGDARGFRASRRFRRADARPQARGNDR